MVEFAHGKNLSAGGDPERRDGPTFGEVVGQAELKRALLAVGASDALSGLLVRGEKGTAKSTAVRALADLLPEQRVVTDCPFGCHPDPEGDDPGARAAPPQCGDCRARSDPPVGTRPTPLVTLPLGATRDRLVGTLSVADALDGAATFDPGLLARANRGILYVDEVNLLDDHLVDALLDAAASGVNRVERDGVSVRHPAEFTLVGTMNPEEGELRPQFRDRFDLQATVAGLEDVEDRVRVLRGALARDRDEQADPAGDDPDHGARLQRARERLAAGDVTLPDEFAADIAETCRDAGVEGHRADVATARAALAFAALDDRPRVLASDVRRAAELALPHRLRSRPFEDAPDAGDLLDERFGEPGDADEGEAGEEEAAGDGNGDGGAGDDADDGTEPSDAAPDDRADEPPVDQGGDGDGDRSDTPTPDAGDDTGATDDGDGSDPTDVEAPAPAAADDGDATGGSPGATDPDAGDEAGEADEATPGTPLVPGQARGGVGEARAPDLPTPDPATDGRDAAGGGSATAPAGETGPRVRTRRATGDESVDAAASVRAAAARGSDRVGSRDLRAAVRAGDATTLVLFVVDASASMRPAMRAARGTLLELLRESYRARDEVGLVAFAGDGADVVLPPTDSTTRAARHLKRLPTGDRTPLPAGLRTATEVLDRADPAASVVVLVTDGRANAGERPVDETRAAARGLATTGARVLVVDAGADDRTGLAGLVVEETDGERIPLADLSAERVDAVAGATGADE
jgi:magnesium chelatase subunit D